MSVYFQTVAIYGYEIDMGTLPTDDEWGDPYEHDFVQEHLPDDASTGQIVVCCDWRGGNFAYIGVLQAKTNSTRKGEQTVESTNHTAKLDPDNVDVHKLMSIHNLLDAYDVDLAQDGPICHHMITLTS